MSTAQNGAPGTASTNEVMDGRRTIFATGANMRHVRHAQILERWPILPEDWAKAVELTRVSAVDRTPGTATFGR
jgi:hypothetical protein